MARKNSKKRYRKEHQKNVRDYEEYQKKLQAKRDRRQAKREGKTLSEKVEERREEMKSTRRDRGNIKHTKPVIRSKAKQDQLVEHFKQLKLDRLSLRDRPDAKMEADRIKSSEGDIEMKEDKIKDRKRSKAYRKMVKIALKRASKRPILIKRKMEVD